MLRDALRQFARSPGFTAVAVLSLALGIGANTAIFTLINVVMLKSLPVRDPGALMRITLNRADGKTSGKGSGFSEALWEQLRDRLDVFDGIFTYGSTGDADLSSAGESRPISVGLVSGGFFSTLGVRPAAGRTLSDADDRPGCPAVAVISHAFWQSEYAGRADIAGQTVRLNGQPLQIIGVTEPAFFGIEYGYSVPVWTTPCALAVFRPGSGRSIGSVIGRAKPGVTLEQIRARLAVLGPSILDGNSRLSAVSFAKGDPFLRNIYGDALLLLMAVVGVVLLIACANIANLLLARGAARQREIAVRLALGAGRARLVRQLLTESLLLSVSGAAIGVLIASWGSSMLVSLLTRPGQVALNLSPDWNVLAFSIAAGVATGILFGAAPAWRAVQVDLQSAMKLAGRGSAAGGTRFNAGKALVVAQIALSLVLVVGSGLLLGSWRRVATIDPGFRTEGILVTRVKTGLPADRRAAVYEQIMEQLRSIPGVTAVSAGSRTPFSNLSMAVEVSGLPPSPADKTVVRFNQVSEGFFATLGTPLLAGRDFNRSDTPATPLVAIVSEDLARRFFGRVNVAGEKFQAQISSSMTRGREPGALIEIIGVAANAKEFSLREEGRPMLYFALSQDPAPAGAYSFITRAHGSPQALIPAVKDRIDSRFVLELATLEGWVD